MFQLLYYVNRYIRQIWRYSQWRRTTNEFYKDIKNSITTVTSKHCRLTLRSHGTQILDDLIGV